MKKLIVISVLLFSMNGLTEEIFFECDYGNINPNPDFNSEGQMFVNITLNRDTNDGTLTTNWPMGGSATTYETTNSFNADYLIIRFFWNTSFVTWKLNRETLVLNEPKNKYSDTGNCKIVEKDNKF